MGQSEGRTETPDQTFTTVMDVVSMYHSTVQSFSRSSNENIR